MSRLRIQHTFQGQSGVSEDRFVNTFYAEGAAAPSEPTLAALAQAVFDFYDGVNTPSTEPLIRWYSSTADGTGRNVKIYDLADPLPRAPIFEVEHGPFSVPPGATNLPSECACCMSYAAPAISGLPVARRRGRIYLGPLNDRATADDPDTAECRVDDVFRFAVMNAAVTLKADMFAAAGHVWSMYSPTSDDMLIINRVWSDNAWDTQRRRGIDPTSRLTVDLS